MDGLPSGYGHLLNISQPPQRHSHEIVIRCIPRRPHMGSQAIAVPASNKTETRPGRKTCMNS